MNTKWDRLNAPACCECGESPATDHWERYPATATTSNARRLYYCIKHHPQTRSAYLRGYADGQKNAWAAYQEQLTADALNKEMG